MLTYETIRKIIEEEKASGKLAKVPEDFFKEARTYLDKKSQIGRDWELESAERRLQEIIEIREKKIINLALYASRTKVEPENLTQEEQELFNKILSAFKAFKEALEKSMGEKAREDLVVVLKDLEEFVGIDMQAYGPFKSGDISTMPKANADLLIKKEIARKLEILEAA